MKSQDPATSTGTAQISPKLPSGWFTEEARNELANRHYHLFIRIARSWNVPEPADAASKAIIRALKDFDPDKGLFIGLARKALYFEILDQRRRLARHPSHERLPEDFEIESPEAHPFIDRVALDRMIHDVWVSLNQVDQRLLWLRIVGEFSYNEIMAQMDFVGCPMPPVTMRSRFRRAIRKLSILRHHFDNLEFSEIVESVQRVAKACGTLDCTGELPKRTLRSLKRRKAAQERCKKRLKRRKRS